MPTWNEINREIDALSATDPGACDVIRKKYIEKLQARVGRTVIAYYSGFLQKRQSSGGAHPESAITDLDMNGLMAVVHNVDRGRGLDLIIHTPGGGIEATRAIVGYIYKMFGKDIRAIVPHMAMSAGTMIACATREVLMGKHSCLGPTDPHVKGYPAMGVLAEVSQAISDIRAEPLKQMLYQQVFAKYPPAFIGDCNRAVQGSNNMVSAWLCANMLDGDANSVGKAAALVASLTDYKGTTAHSHHFMVDDCISMGLKVAKIEDDQELQEDILSVHHAFVATFARTDNIKIIQNAQDGIWTVGAQ